MQIPDQLTFSVTDAARLLGMDRGAVHKMVKAGTIYPHESFTTSGKRPTVRITRDCLVRLAGRAPQTATAGTP